MKLPRLAIENYQFTVVVIALLVVAGVMSFVTMPRSEDPAVTVPGASIIVIYPGASPKDLEELVVDPIEEAVNELDDIKKLTSVMEDGLAAVYVEFYLETDPDEKYDDVLQKLNGVRSDLPQDIFRIETHQWTLSSVNILQLAIVSESASYRDLEIEAERLRKELEKVPGIGRAESWAYPKQQVKVSIYLDKLAQLRIPLQQVTDAIRSANMNIPGGSIDMGKKRFNLRTSGAYSSLEDVRSTIIHSSGKDITTLGDVADVGFGYEDETYIARFDGKRAVFVTANQKEGTNIFSIMNELRPRVERFREGLPESMSLRWVFDQSDSVSYRLDKFFENMLQGVALVGVITFLLIGLRASLVVIIVIPMALLIGLTFVDLSGFAIEQVSIAGLVITLGLLVDNAIVVTENISRFLCLGFGRREAAFKATSQIGWAIVSSTVTTVLAFLPMVIMKNMTADFIRGLPVTVIFVLLASLGIALTFTPLVSSMFLKPPEAGRPSLSQRAMSFVVERWYRRALAWSLRHRAVVIVLAAASFGASILLFPLVGVSFFPKAEKPQFVINIDTPEGSSLEHTDAVAAEVESVLAGIDEVAHWAANVGHGNPRIYYNLPTKMETTTHAQIFVQLREYDAAAMERVVTGLRKRFEDYPGGRIRVKELEQGPVTDAPIAIVVMGDNLEILRKIAADVEKIVASAPGAVNTENPMEETRTDLRVDISREKAGMMGIPLVEIDRTVRTSIAGMEVSRFRSNEGEEFDIVVRLPCEGKPTEADFDDIYVASVTGTQVPLKQVASMVQEPGPLAISHFGLDRSVTISADVMSGASASAVTAGIIQKLETYSWPRGYRYFVSGEQEAREESFGGLQEAVIIALIAIFAVLVLQFRSFVQPLVVYSAIPLALVGSVVALLVTRNSFSFTAFIGLTSLVGIVVNNSIILVDYTNQLRADGKGLVEAVAEAGETRFRPIILTTATTIGGLLPLTLRGGTVWAPLGWCIIGGLLVSTLLTLIVVPVLYSLVGKAADRNANAPSS
jgi:multidrug efflux pump subunit AcrB